MISLSPHTPPVSTTLSILLCHQVQIYNPAFFKYIHDHWTRHHGRYPSTGMLVLFFALHVCDEVRYIAVFVPHAHSWHRLV